MNTLPTNPYPRDAEGYEHPFWCDPALCTAPSSLRLRNAAEADVPVLLTNAHLGAAKVIGGDRMVETQFTLQPWRMVDQPVTDEVEGVDLYVELKDGRLKTVVMVTVEQLSPLSRAFAELRDIAYTGRPRTPVQRATQALAEFGVLDAGEAARMLPMYHREHLTRDEAEQVIDWFVDGTDELRRDGAE